MAEKAWQSKCEVGMTVRKETDGLHSQREWVTEEKKEQDMWPSCKAAKFSPSVTLPAARLQTTGDHAFEHVNLWKNTLDSNYIWEREYLNGASGVEHR